MNNSSLLTADRMTHLKIVVMALVCATLVAGVGIAARVTDGTTGISGRLQATGPVIKAAQAGDRVDRRGQHRPLTSFRSLNPPLCAPSGALFLSGVTRRTGIPAARAAASAPGPEVEARPS